MQGIKVYSHNDRTEIVNQIVKLLKHQFKDNLVAVAAEGSYARGNDKDFSDLELTVFLKEIPKDTNFNIHKIVDGLLIVVIFDTKESFVKKYLSDDFSVWYASGSEDMLPITNKHFIDKLNKIIPNNIEQKCLDQIKIRWPQYQEITAKLLNNINDGNLEAVSLVFPLIVKETLVILSYLNQTPYTTLARYIFQAKKFQIKPKGFVELINMSIDGKYTNLRKLKRIVLKIFSDLESILESKGLILYLDKLENLWQ